MAVAGRAGWSGKHLATRIRDQVGIGPRSFRRLLRFHRPTDAVSADPRPDWAGLAHDAGYCDQPHLIREFCEFAGLSPSDYIARLAGGGGGVIEHRGAFDVFEPPVARDYGGTGYSARDPEGNVWSFGDYDPWADAG